MSVSMRGVRERSNGGQKRLLAHMSWFSEFDPFVGAHFCFCLEVLAWYRDNGWRYGQALMEEVGGRILKVGAQSRLGRGCIQKGGRER